MNLRAAFLGLRQRHATYFKLVTQQKDFAMSIFGNDFANINTTNSNTNNEPLMNPNGVYAARIIGVVAAENDYTAKDGKVTHNSGCVFVVAVRGLNNRYFTRGLDFMNLKGNILSEKAKFGEFVRTLLGTSDRDEALKQTLISRGLNDIEAFIGTPIIVQATEKTSKQGKKSVIIGRIMSENEMMHGLTKDCINDLPKVNVMKVGGSFVKVHPEIAKFEDGVKVVMNDEPAQQPAATAPAFPPAVDKQALSENEISEESLF